MRLHDLIRLTEEAKDASQFAKRVIANLKAAGWDPTYEDKPMGGTFTTKNKNGKTEFRVSVVNIRDGREEQGMRSSKMFNQAINEPYRAARETGITFTQPVGMPNTHWESEQYSGTVMQFFIG